MRGRKAASFMMRPLSLILAALTISTAAQATSVPPRQYAPDELPKGGRLVTGADGVARYWFVPSSEIATRKENFGKRAGLYFCSGRGSDRFELLESRFDVLDFFVHPTTRTLYAVFRTSSVAPGPDGFLKRVNRDMVAKSENGTDWKEISPKSGLTPREPYSLIQDPDHPNRVCVVMGVVHRGVLQSKDDEYSAWRDWNEAYWKQNHPDAGKEDKARP